VTGTLRAPLKIAQRTETEMKKLTPGLVVDQIAALCRVLERSFDLAFFRPGEFTFDRPGSVILDVSL